MFRFTVYVSLYVDLKLKESILQYEFKKNKNRLMSSGLKPVIGLAKNSCIASYYKQFSMNIKKNIKLIPVMLPLTFDPPPPRRGNKISFNFIIFTFNIREKLSIIRCYNNNKSNTSSLV